MFCRRAKDFFSVEAEGDSLFEADFNRLDKTTYNRRGLPRLQENITIPFEVIGRIREKSSQHEPINENSNYDISI